MTTKDQTIIPTSKLVIVNYGTEGAGKTVSAGTVSKQFPKALPAPRPTNITDTFWLCADTLALASMRKQNIFVQNSFDIPEFLGNKDLQRAEKMTTPAAWTDGVRIGLGKIDTWLKANPNGNVVIDTFSAIAGGLQSEFAKEQLGTKFSVNAPADGRKMYGQLKVGLGLFTDYLMSMPFGICLVLVHSKALQDFVTDPNALKKAANVRKAGKTLEEAEIVPDVEGSGFKYVMRHALFVFPIMATRAPGAKTRTRSFITSSAASNGWLVKNKMEGLFADKEPAHWLNLIAKANKR